VAAAAGPIGRLLTSAKSRPMICFLARIDPATNQEECQFEV
jgi:hypothetical protein